MIQNKRLLPLLLALVVGYESVPAAHAGFKRNLLAAGATVVGFVGYSRAMHEYVKRHFRDELRLLTRRDNGLISEYEFNHELNTLTVARCDERFGTPDHRPTSLARYVMNMKWYINHLHHLCWFYRGEYRNEMKGTKKALRKIWLKLIVHPHYNEQRKKLGL